MKNEAERRERGMIEETGDNRKVRIERKERREKREMRWVKQREETRDKK